MRPIKPGKYGLASAFMMQKLSSEGCADYAIGTTAPAEDNHTQIAFRAVKEDLATLEKALKDKNYSSAEMIASNLAQDSGILLEYLKQLKA